MIAGLDRAADRRWFLPAVSVFPLSDYVLPFLPNQMMLVALSVLQPRRWWVFAVTFALSSGLGALLTALVVQAVGPWVLESLFGGMPDEGAAAGVLTMVERHGLWALALLAMLPWPPRSGVVACALAGLPPLGIAAAVTTGRIVPVGVYAFVGSKAPHLLRRFRSVDLLLREVDELRLTSRVQAQREPEDEDN